MIMPIHLPNPFVCLFFFPKQNFDYFISLKAKKIQIDDLSRDDLIRFVKKQIDKLKTAKCENDKLKMELVEVQMNFTVC